MGAGASLALIAGLTACGGSSSPATPTGVDGPPAAAKPASNGTLAKVTWVPFAGEPRTLEIGQATAGYPEITIISNMCENLLRLQPDGSLAPGLTELPEHPDPLTYIFKVRSGPKFWDGKPVTAADVVYSLRQSSAPTAANAFWLLGVKSISQRGADQVVVKLSTPNVTLPDYLAMGAGIVAEKAYAVAKGKAYGSPAGGIMCSGPFKLGPWTRGRSLTVMRNPNYWDTAHAAHVDELEFRFIEDPTTLTSALLGGEVDGTFAAPVADLKRLAGSDAGTLTQGPSLQVLSLSVLAPTGPMADPRIRQALNLAVDRDAFAKTVGADAAEPVRSSILPATWSYNKTAFQQAYDALPGAKPDLPKARQLVQQAGTPKQPIVIATSAEPSLQPIAVYTQSVLKAIGLKSRVKVIPSFAQFLTLFYDPKARKGLDLIVNYNLAGMAEPLQLLASIALPTGLNNYNAYDDKKVAALIQRALASESEADRTKLITQADALYEQAPTSFMLAAPKTNVWQSKRIAGAPASWMYLTTPWGAALRPAQS
jgi:peptide/nickel transport system substrate-binding protein